MRPDAGKAVEIGRLIPRPILIAPEFDRHGQMGIAADQLAGNAANGTPLIIQRVDIHAEHRTLQFTAMHRLQRIAAEETGADIRAAGNGREMHIRLPVAIDIIEGLRDERRAGGENCPQR